MVLVSGQVMFNGNTPNVKKALLTVKLEDVSLVGMPSTVVAVQKEMVDLSTDNAVVFELFPTADSPVINPRSSYSVMVHVSLHPDENPDDIMQGDYLTMQSYPVLTQGNPSNVTIEVKRVG